MLPLADGHLPPAVSKMGCLLEHVTSCGCLAIQEEEVEMLDSEVVSLILFRLRTQAVYKG